MTATHPAASRGLVAVLIALFAIAWFAGIGARRLVHPDEGRYAEIAREMAASGDWVTPRLNGLKYFEKPPLQYWMTAAAFRALGVHEWTARLWPALVSFAAVLFIGYTGLRLGGPPLGLAAGAALGGSAWFVVNSHFLSLDAGLASFLGIALGAFLIAQRPEATTTERAAWMLAAWAAMALATLSKGPIGLVLPGGALVVYTLLQRDFALWRRLHLGRGLVVFAALCAPWFVLVARSNDEFLHFFFVHEHFQRFLTTTHRRIGAWWYFLPYLAAGLLPWLLVFVFGLRRLATAGPRAGSGFSWQRFALAWSAFVLVFFSASGSKLPSYILPMFPALALLVGFVLVAADLRWLARLNAALTLLAAVGAAALLLVDRPLLLRFGGEEAQLPSLLAYRTWLVCALAISVAGGLVAWRAFARGGAGGRMLGIVAIALAAALTFRVAETGFDAFRGTRSSYDLLARAQAAHGPLAPDLPFFQVRMYDQTAPFYLRRTTTLVDFRDELALGIDAEPHKAHATVADWQSAWSALDQGYALMSPAEAARLAALGVPMRELARDSRRVLVSRR
jgi:4-amino-4-deoxy-L-arabinose transferase-like glycosyltransferase